MNVEALLRESQDVRESAERLLHDLRIIEQWQPYGEVELAGAYRWDLMLAPDVDLYVVNPNADLDLALDAFSHFARLGEFLALGFIDSVRGKPAWAHPATYPVGHYIGWRATSRGGSGRWRHGSSATPGRRWTGWRRS